MKAHPRAWVVGITSRPPVNVGITSSCGTEHLGVTVVDMNTMKHSDTVRVAEAIRRTGLQITSNHVTRLIRAGRIPANRIGGHWYVRPEDLTAALITQGAAS